MEKYEQLKKVIQEANPEIMELKFGCEFIDVETGEVLVYLGETNVGATLAYSRKEVDTYHDDWNWEVNKVLGRPIRLDDLRFVLPRTSFLDVCSIWKAGFLSEQPEEVINRAYNGLPKER